jgi:hypothetical protein
VAGHPQVAQRLDLPAAVLRHAGPNPSQRRAGGSVGVERVGLTGEPAGLAVGPVDLDQRHTLAGQVSGQPSPVGPGPLDADDLQRTEGTQPAEQLPVPGRGGRELAITQPASGHVDHRSGVSVSVGVHTTSHLQR